MKFTKDQVAQVVDMLTADKPRTKEDVVTFFSVVTDSPKADVRIAVEELVAERGIDTTKPKPMSEQLSDWYIAQGAKALELSREDIEKQAKAIGMTKGSLRYYTDMYTNVSKITKKLMK